jgi:hypothetical protein
VSGAPDLGRGWRQIELEAMEESRATLILEETLVLPPGSLTAWTEARHGHTDGFSVVHRVGQAIAGVATTLCGEVVPEPIKRVALSAGLVRALGRCRYCENRYVERAA